MKKKVYSLRDIEKILTYIPPIFIFFLSLFLFIIGSVFLEYKEKNDKSLILQKLELQQQFKFENELKKLVQTTDNELQKNLESIELKLKQEVHTLLGFSMGLQKHQDSLHVKHLDSYIKASQTKHDIQFAIFDEDYNILYGQEVLNNIQELIFSERNNKELLKITLMYIASQGQKSSFRWKDDIRKTIQLSYFETYGKWHIGVFSSIDSLKKITQNLLLENIASLSSREYFVWLYDIIEKKVYNLENKHKWQISKKQSAKISYTYDKYYFTLGLVPTKRLYNQKDIDKISEEYKDKKALLFLIILITSITLVFSTTLFSSFIKRIFSSHNKRLENKNRLLNTWKERFELAVIASNDGLWDTNFNTNKTFFSKKWLDMLGYAQGDIKSYQEWFALIHKDDRAYVNHALNQHINEDKEHIICEYRLKTKDNRYKWVLARGKVFLNPDKTPKRLLMMSMDIDESKRLEQNIKDTELLVATGNIIILRIQNSPTLEVLFVSNSIRTYGYSNEDFFKKGLKYLDIIHEEDKDSFIASLNAYLKQGFHDFSKSYRIITKSGEVKWVFNRMLFIKDDFGNVTNLYGYIYDITALKQSEIELEEKIKIEVEKNQEKQKLLIQQNKLAAMGEMIGSIAHQWRQPLNNISLILHFIKDNYKKMDETQIQKYTSNAKEQLEYMSTTIDDFRNFYKPSKKRVLFDVATAIEASISILKSQIQKNEISLELSDQTFKIFGFENEFKQAILNILSNAIEAIKQNDVKNGTIKIEINKSSIEIKNNGGVASKEVLERMFEPYFTTKFEDKGTGIGLYMTKTIIENMQGHIKSFNTQDGVAFLIEF